MGSISVWKTFNVSHKQVFGTSTVRYILFFSCWVAHTRSVCEEGGLLDLNIQERNQGKSKLQLLLVVKEYTTLLRPNKSLIHGGRLVSYPGPCSPYLGVGS